MRALIIYLNWDIQDSVGEFSILIEISLWNFTRLLNQDTFKVEVIWFKVIFLIYKKYYLNLNMPTA